VSTKDGSGTQASTRRSPRAEARRSSGTPKITPEAGGSPLERYRFPIIVGAIVLGLVAVGFVLIGPAAGAPYTCGALMTPGPVEPAPTPRPEPTAAPATPVPSADPAASPGASAAPAPTPEPQPTQRVGFVATDLGRGHVGQGESVSYLYCPPTSGQHYNVQNLSPLRRDFYGPNDKLTPGNWIHNLEHGYVVILYRGDPGAEALDTLESIMENAPPGPLSAACGLPNKVIGVRFDDMSTPYGAVSWDRALLLETLDAEQLATYAAQWQDAPVTPEQAC